MSSQAFEPQRSCDVQTWQSEGASPKSGAAAAGVLNARKKGGLTTEREAVGWMGGWLVGWL